MTESLTLLKVVKDIINVSWLS